MPRFTHVYFDFDSTLLAEESLDALADQHGCGEEVRKLTEASMSGIIPLEKVFPHKLDLIAPSKTKIEAYLLSSPAFVIDAKETIEQLKEQGIKVGIITSNFHQIVDPLAAQLGIEKEDIYANTLFYDNEGNYRGFDHGAPLTQGGGKATVLRTIKQSNEHWAFIGDSVTDLCCVGIADLMIGFGGIVAREEVRKRADAFVSGPSLKDILPLLLS